MELAKSVPGVTAVNKVEPQMGGEDFPFYLQHIKGAFFFKSGQNPELNAIYPPHHPKFNIDEKEC
jgi:amidohydrolase